MDITPRVEVGGGLVLVGREIQALVTGVSLGGHAALVFSTDLTPERSTAVGALVGAPVQLVLPAPPVDPTLAPPPAAGAGGSGNGSSPDGADGPPNAPEVPAIDDRVPHLVFRGVVRQVELVARPQGGSRLVVEALGASYALGAHRTQQRFPAQTVLNVARAMGVRVDATASQPAPGSPAPEPLHLVQTGESDWAFLARLAADEGLVLRPAWPRLAPDGAPASAADADVDVARGFRSGDDARHVLTYGRELLAAAGGVDAVNAGVSGAHYDVAGSHAHAYQDVRQAPAWLGGARPLVAAAQAQAAVDAGGGSPGLVPEAVRAPTPALFRARLRRASERRVGGAVRVTGHGVVPALRPGDRVVLESGADPRWALSSAVAGEHGVLAVVHRWDGQRYETGFVATPWAGYHPEPDGAADAAAPLLAAAGAALGPMGADAHGRGGHVGAGHGGALAVLGGALGGAAQATLGGALGRALGGPVGHALGGPLGGALGGVMSGRAGGHGAGAHGAGGHAAGSPVADLAAMGAGGAGGLLALLTGAGPAAGAVPPRRRRHPVTFGVVVDDADPECQGRVRVRYAWQAPDAPPGACGWARVASVVGGRGRGLGALPSKGDEVLVAFADGHPERPVVLRALWSGRDEAAHRPGLQHWVTPAGNTLRFLEGKPREEHERVELYTPDGTTWVQLAAKGPGGVPLVTVRSAGDLHVEAPEGVLRLHARAYEAHVAGDQRTEVAGAHTAKVRGAVALESAAAAVGLAGRGGVTLRAGGALALAAGGGHQTTGAKVELRPGGGPGVAAPNVPAAASAFRAPALPPAGRLRHTGPSHAPPDRVARTTSPSGPTPKPRPAVTFTTCTTQGLASQPSAADFGKGVRQLQSNWGPLSKDQRRARLQDLLNAQLAAADVPGIKIRDVALTDGTVGRLYAQAWQLDVSTYLLIGPTLSDKDALELSKTSYHEARHAEQRFLMARRRAALGEDAKTIEATGVRRDVAQLASKNPLPTRAASVAACAAAWDESYFGSGRTARETLYSQYPEPATSTTKAAATEVFRYRRGTDQYARAYTAWQAADKHLQTLQNQYLSLPEENDAFASENLLVQSWHDAAQTATNPPPPMAKP